MSGVIGGPNYILKMVSFPQIASVNEICLFGHGPNLMVS